MNVKPRQLVPLLEIRLLDGSACRFPGRQADGVRNDSLCRGLRCPVWKNYLGDLETKLPAASYNAGGAPGFIVLRSFLGEFVTDGGAHLTERPLGEFEVDVFFSGPGQISCTIRLTDSNADDPVKVQVRGLIVFFR